MKTPLFPDVHDTLYVYLRRYKGLRSSGYAVTEKTVAYEPFQLNVTFRHFSASPKAKCGDNNGGIFLIIVAIPIPSIYKSN